MSDSELVYNLWWCLLHCRTPLTAPWTFLTSPATTGIFEHTYIFAASYLTLQNSNSLLKGLRWCGLPTPWLSKGSLISRLFYLMYDIYLVVIVIYVLFSYTYTIMTTYIQFQDLCGLGVSTSNYMCGVLVTVHQWRFRHRLKKLTNHMDTIVGTILRADLGQEEFFVRLYNKNCNLMTILVNVSIFFAAVAPSCYCFSVPAMDWMSGEYGTHFPVLIKSPFDDRQPGVYEFILFVVACCMCISIAKKVATDCLFISLLKIEISFFMYLYNSMSGFKKEFMNGNNALAGKKLILWIRLHQSVLRSTTDLMSIFSPIVITYYIAVICIVVCGAFVQIMKDNDNIIQSLTIGSFVMTTLVYHFLLANAADELTAVAQNLSSIVYDMPWYKMERDDVSLVRMVMVMASRPVLLTAYRAPVFLLNRENFSTFVVSAISAFVTFCQLKTLYG